MAFYLKQDRDMLFQESCVDKKKISLGRWIGTALGLNKLKHSKINEIEMNNLKF